MSTEKGLSGTNRSRHGAGLLATGGTLGRAPQAARWDRRAPPDWSFVQDVGQALSE